MPRPHNALGRAGTAVIPADWSDSHRPVDEKTMTAVCAIRLPGGTKGEFDPATNVRPTTPYAPFYTGPCRVQALSDSDSRSTAADQDVSLRRYIVTVPWDQPDGDQALLVDALVTVTDAGSNGDPSLTGRELTITEIGRGSLTWERVLICQDNNSSSRPTA